MKNSKINTRKWDVFHCPLDIREELSKQLDIPPLIAQLLIKRGIMDPLEGERFLSPNLSHLHDPLLMKDVDKAVERIISALSDKENVLVYGDYDVDGITACALLVDFLRSLGIQTSYYIPDRMKEGYGLNLNAVKSIAAQGIRLMICVDCGVSDRDELKLAYQLGMDTIVVDHHEVPALPLLSYATVNPLRTDCPYPFKGLAGIGVVFNLVVALRGRLRAMGFWQDRFEPNLRRYLDLVALGTIADVVPIIDINRVMVKYGLKELGDSIRPGIRALKNISNICESNITTEHVAYRLAPRINAAGRMGDGKLGVELLLAKEDMLAQKIAEDLDQANRKRQLIEERMYQEARDIIKHNNLLEYNSMVLHSDGWHPGVIGIVASKIAEEFWRPTVLIALDGEIGKGSARSISRLNLYQVLRECEAHLLGFGGHKYAAGLKINRDKIKSFRMDFENAIKRRMRDHDIIPTISIDAEMSLSDLTPELMSYISLLSPYGPNNPKPLFSTRESLPVHDIKVLSKDTLKFKLKDGNMNYEIIGFGMGDLAAHLPSTIRIAFHPQMNDWEGHKKIQCELKAVELDDNN